MGRTPLNLNARRGRSNSNASSQGLSDVEKDVYNLIKSKEGMGILLRDLKYTLKLVDAVVKKSLKSLESRKLIKSVADVHHKLIKHYMAVEFEPSVELTGGSWYAEGKIDSDFIQQLKDLCLNYIGKLEVVTAEGLFDYIRKSGILKVEFTSYQILEILQVLVLEGMIEKVKSTGEGAFASIPLGSDCYKRLSRRPSKVGILSSIPCGVCPKLGECTPDGLISPTNCVYFKKWLEF